MSNLLIGNRTLIGGQGGQHREASGLKDNRGTVRKLSVWSTDWNIAAIRVQFDNGTFETIGQTKGNYSELVLSPEDRLVSAMLAGNGARNPADLRLGSIRLIFEGGREFHARMSKPYDTEQTLEIGSGILMGVEARAGADIDALSLLMLRPVVSSVLRDVIYEDLSHWNDKILVDSIDSFSDVNQDDEPTAWEFEGSWVKQVQSSWATATSSEMTFGARVEAGIPEIVTVEASFQFKVGSTFSHGATISDTVSRRWMKHGVLQPGDAVHLEAIVGTAQINLGFEAVLDVEVDTGDHWKRPVKGFYSGVSASKVILKTTDGQFLPADERMLAIQHLEHASA